MTANQIANRIKKEKVLDEKGNIQKVPYWMTVSVIATAINAGIIK